MEQWLTVRALGADDLEIVSIIAPLEVPPKSLRRPHEHAKEDHIKKTEQKWSLHVDFDTKLTSSELLPDRMSEVDVMRLWQSQPEYPSHQIPAQLANAL